MDMEIGEFIAAVGQSISDAQQSLEQRSIKNFFDYFDPKPGMAVGEDTALEPKTKTLILPCAEDISKNEPIQIPLAALAHHSNIKLESVKVKMKMRLSPNRNNELRVDLTAPQTQDVQPERDENAAESAQHEMELVFQVSDPSEGIARVTQNITRVL